MRFVLKAEIESNYLGLESMSCDVSKDLVLMVVLAYFSQKKRISLIAMFILCLELSKFTHLVSKAEVESNCLGL